MLAAYFPRRMRSATLLGCGVALRLVDFNYPVWNSLVRGCGAPVISMALIAAYLKLV